MKMKIKTIRYFVALLLVPIMISGCITQYKIPSEGEDVVNLEIIQASVPGTKPSIYAPKAGHASIYLYDNQDCRRPQVLEKLFTGGTTSTKIRTSSPITLFVRSQASSDRNPYIVEMCRVTVRFWPKTNTDYQVAYGSGRDGCSLQIFKKMGDQLIPDTTATRQDKQCD